MCSLLDAYFDFERVTIHWLVNVEVYLVVARDRYENQLREREGGNSREAAVLMLFPFFFSPAESRYCESSA